MPIRPLGILALLLMLTASCAAMAPVRGRLVPGANPAARMSDAIVYVVPQGTTPERGFRKSRAALVLHEGRFQPRIATTSVGSRILLKNRDHVFHKPFSRSPAAPFVGHPLRSRESRTIPVRSTGMVRIFCELHAKESAEVLVIHRGLATRPDHRGRFSLGGLPPGKYSIHVWHPSRGDRATPLDLSGGGPMQVELRF